MLVFPVKSTITAVALLALAAGSSDAFLQSTVGRSSSCCSTTTTTTAVLATSQHDTESGDRRSFLGAGAAALFTVTAAIATTTAPSPAFAEQTAEYRQGIKVDAFNGLIFNYRGGDYNGLSAEEVINEPSVSYADFNERLKKGEVEFVEFLAPDGDKAYVTFKSSGEASSKQAPIRIGEGYPIEQHDGYSSPMFAVRAVKNAGVPYKFVVPGLSKYTSS